jgi:hypothetical protein
MQTLNVGAGRTNEDYRAAEEQRRADLQADGRSAAIYFFVAAGLAGLGTGLLPLRLNILVNIGIIDLLPYYGGHLFRLHPLLVTAAAGIWVVALVALGFAAQKGHRWAFLTGVVLYGADMIALGLAFSFLSIGIHGFFILKWFQGQRALQESKIP